MTRALRWAVLFPLALTASAPSLADAPPPSGSTVAPFAATRIRAHLFYESSGKVDERDLISGDVTLWNTIIGEGEAAAPSNTTLVVVELTGPAFLANTKGSLTLVATSDKRLLRRETVKLSTFFNKGSKLYVPFFIMDTGCGVLKLDAKLAVPGHKSALTKAVDFPCGE